MHAATPPTAWRLGILASAISLGHSLALCQAASAQTAATLPSASQTAPAAGAPSERAELERLRATTTALIDALVSQGLLTRERADAILRDAAAAATSANSAAASPAATAPTWGTPLPRPPGSGVIRVPYISETQRAQLRDEIRNEVMTTAREEGWADARQVPPWTRGIRLGGDLRLRWQAEHYPPARYEIDRNTGVRLGGVCDVIGGNLPAECYRGQTLSPAWAPDLTNTTENRERLTLRARLALDAKVSDDTSVGLRLSTGSTSGPTSSSQTLGTNFNKASVVLDRAYLRWEPRYNLRFLAGRMPNPFFGSDLIWPDDLSFDGIAAQGELNLGNGLFLFGTGGLFPLEEFNLDRRDKWLYALQGGAEWAFSPVGTLRVGLAVYDFANVEGRRESQPKPGEPRGSTVAYQSSQYPSTVRLKGNTLINLNDPSTIATATPVWGLASKFLPVTVSGLLTYKGFDAVQLGLGLDWVQNTGFDAADIRRRALDDSLTGLAPRTRGLQVKLQMGRDSVVNKGDWQASLAWRKLERDAWIDGFTDTTWHLGGTNYMGWQLGGQYAFDSRSTLGLRLTSTSNLDDGVRLSTGVSGVQAATLSSAPLKIDVLQIDLNTRF